MKPATTTISVRLTPSELEHLDRLRVKRPYRGPEPRSEVLRRLLAAAERKTARPRR